MRIHKSLGSNHIRTSAYFHEMTKIYKTAYQNSLHTSLIGLLPDRNEIIFNDSVTLPHRPGSESDEEMINGLKTCNDKVFLVKWAPKIYKKFVEIESLCTYRCAWLPRLCKKYGNRMH